MELTVWVERRTRSERGMTLIGTFFFWGGGGWLPVFAHGPGKIPVSPDISHPFPGIFDTFDLKIFLNRTLYKTKVRILFHISFVAAAEERSNLVGDANGWSSERELLSLGCRAS